MDPEFKRGSQTPQLSLNTLFWSQTLASDTQELCDLDNLPNSGFSSLI